MTINFVTTICCCICEDGKNRICDESEIIIRLYGGK